MREIAVTSFISLDGVVQGPVQPDEDTSGGFEHSGWASSYFEETMELVNAELMETPISFLFGRRTYEMFSSHWPNSKTSHGDLLNRSQKYVVSSSLQQANWQNTEIISGDVKAELRRIKSEEGPRLQVHGSINLIQTLLAGDLIDEFRLLTFPIVLGSGRRLFSGGGDLMKLTLAKLATTSNGVSMGVYRRS